MELLRGGSFSLTMSVLLNLQGKDLRQLLQHLTLSSQLFGSPVSFLRINLSPTIRYPTHFSSSILSLEMESTHTHQSFPCKSEINNPSNRWMFATSENWKPNQIKSNLNKKRPKSQHQIASERRHHPYNVIPLPSTLARGVVTGKPCEHATCSVPFKEMVGSSSCRCLLLVGPVISLWFFIPFSFSGEIFIARKSLVASTWPSVVFSFIPYDGQQKHIKPISQHPSFATTNKIWSTSKRQDLSVVVLPSSSSGCCCSLLLLGFLLLRWSLGNPNSSWPLLLK